MVEARAVGILGASAVRYRSRRRREASTVLRHAQEQARRAGRVRNQPGLFVFALRPDGHRATLVRQTQQQT
jgi:hypothetical protein